MTQKDALEIVELGYSVYLTGEAGSGKTYLLNKFISFLQKKHAHVGITASTGIAATHLGGRTIDSWSGLGMRDDIALAQIHQLAQKPSLRKRIQKTKVLIIDEVSMIHGKRLDAIDQICRVIKGINAPFGGMQIVLTGDFFQLPPVSEERRNFDYVYKSRVWQEMNPHILYLESQYRQTDPQFNDVLYAIRNNCVSDHTIALLRQTMGQEIEGGITPTKLYTHNIDVDAINQGELNKIMQEPHVYNMEAHGNEEVVGALKRGCLAPERLVLKKGAQVMFVRNNFEAGYSNGTVGKVIGFEKNMPIVETYDKKRIVVTPIQWTVTEEEKVYAELVQVPLRLAWAITIHKSQGMTLSCAEVDLSKSFVHGMGYVALSRVRSLKGIKLLGINQLALQVNPEITEYDKHLRHASIQEVHKLKKMGWIKKFFARRKYSYFLTS